MSSDAPVSSQILPDPTRRNVLITSALPYVNNVPHLGNIIGCVLSADVYARFLRKRGVNTLYVCGTDEYGTATETKAIEEKCTPKQLCDRFHAVHKDIYDWFGISFDIFGRTTTDNQTVIAQDIFLSLEKNALLSQENMDQLFCNSCQRFLADRFVEGTCPNCGFDDARGDQCDKCNKLLNATELKFPKCKLCRSPPETRTSRHVFLDLPAIKDDLEKWVKASSVKGAWSNNTILATEAWINAGLKKRCITRDLKWGTPVPMDGFREKVFYVWFDAPIGYISITACYTPEWKKWWQNPEHVDLVQFMGKDNVPFHTVIFPSSLIGTKQPWTLVHHVSTTEYLNYETGKFSKSRGTGVFGDNARESGIPPECFRYYLLANRPEASDSIFNWNDFEGKINNELLANLGNFFNRTLKFIKDKLGGAIPKISAGDLNDDDRKFVADINTVLQQYNSLLDKVHLKEGLRCVMEASSLANKFSQTMKAWDLLKSDPARCNVVMGILARMVYFIANLTEPFLPQLAKKVMQQMNLPPRMIPDTIDFDTILPALPEGHALGDVEALVPQIRGDRIEELRDKYGGPKLVEFPLDIRIGTINKVSKHDSANLYVLSVDMGKGTSRQIVSGLCDFYAEEELVNRQILLLVNLKPRAFQGVQSQGMLLTSECTDDAGAARVSLLHPRSHVENGTQVVPAGTSAKPKDKLELKHFQQVNNKIGAEGQVLFNDSHAWQTAESEVQITTDKPKAGALIK